MHKCVRCGNTFEDSDSTILRGCTGCGGIFFLYMKGPEDVQKLDAVEQDLQRKDTTLEKEIVKQIESKKTEEPVSEEKEEAGEETVTTRVEGDYLEIVQEEVEDKPEKIKVKEKPARKRQVVETIRVPREGVYEINIDALMKSQPLIVLEKGKVYIIHLPQSFDSVKRRLP